MRKGFISVVAVLISAVMLSIAAFGASETSTPAAMPVEAAESEAPAKTAPESAEDEPREAKFADIFELYSYWCGMYEYYPDYVCGVWSTDGTADNLTVAVTKDEKGEEGKKEILSLIENDDNLTFTYMTYPYRDLRLLQEKLTVRLQELKDKDIGGWGIGVAEMENVVEVDIDASHPDVQALIQECFEKYNDMVIFNHIDGFEITAQSAGFIEPAGGEAAVDAVGETGAVVTTGITTEKKDNGLVIYAAFGAAVIIIGMVIFAVRRVRVRQTNAGNVTASSGLSRSQVEEILRSTEEEPNEEIFKAVMDEIGNE